jgi:hypothetical protein
MRDRLPSLDTLVYAAEQFDRLTSHPTIGFWASVIGDMLRVA